MASERPMALYSDPWASDVPEAKGSVVELVGSLMGLYLASGGL